MYFLQTFFLTILNMSITASYVIIIVLILRFMIQKAPKIFSYLLWSVVGFRLICPVSFSSLFSILNFSFIQRKTLGGSSGTIEYIPISASMLKAANSAANISVENDSINRILPVTTSFDKISFIQGFLFLCVILWVLGITAFIVYSLVSYIKLKCHVANAVILKENIYECDQIPTPFVLGILKPNIYIPFRLQEKEMVYILMHEQYHIKRLDHIVKPFSFLLLVIYWFNPLIWVAYHLMNQDMEMSCDEKVLKDIGYSGRTDYSRSLLSFAVNRRFQVPGPIAFGEMNVKERIKNILNPKMPNLRLTLLIGMLCMIIVFACAANPYQKARNDTSLDYNQTMDLQKDKHYAEMLYESKNPYIGNVSANGQLLSLLEVYKSLGNYTLEMETSKKPYILRLNFIDEVTDRSFFDTKMFGYATLLLALIDNADEIQWSYPYTDTNGEMKRYTIFWNEVNLKTIGINEIKNYGKSSTQIQNLLEFINHYHSDLKFTYAENITDVDDGRPEDENILTMNEILSQNNWNNVNLDYFESFHNAKRNNSDKDKALNALMTFSLSYGNDTYELQVSYRKEDKQIDSIRFLNKTNSDSILLYAADSKQKVNTDVEAFLKK